jgi:hypothetical protein
VTIESVLELLGYSGSVFRWTVSNGVGSCVEKFEEALENLGVVVFAA